MGVRKKSLVMIFVLMLMIFLPSVNCKNNARLIKESTVVDSDIIIPDDFPTIQEGIDNSNPGDTIFVRSGIYKENIVINKVGINLWGENKFNTVIDIENTADDAVVIFADEVTFQGFTVTNARCKDKLIWNQTGVLVFSSNVTVKDNVFSDNSLGLISYASAYNLTVCDNLFFYDGFFPANYLLTDNIPLESVFLNVSNNTVNGKPLYYYKNVHDTVIGADAGQIILVNCTNVIIKNMYLTYTDFSIIFYYCSNCVIENSTVANTDGEVILFYSENNTIENNTAINNLHGLCLDLGSKNNVVRNNELYRNFGGISVISDCIGNRVYGNKIHNNNWGVEIISYSKNLPSHDNLVYENEIYDNDLGIRLSATFKDPLRSTYNNSITDNSIFKNKVGIQIYLSEGNIIINNTFRRNLVSALFLGCSQNTWQNNYWGRPRILPKIIFGYKMILNTKMPIPWFNIDRHPARASN